MKCYLIIEDPPPNSDQKNVEVFVEKDFKAKNFIVQSLVMFISVTTRDVMFCKKISNNNIGKKYSSWDNHIRRKRLI